MRRIQLIICFAKHGLATSPKSRFLQADSFGLQNSQTSSLVFGIPAFHTLKMRITACLQFRGLPRPRFSTRRGRKIAGFQQQLHTVAC